MELFPNESEEEDNGFTTPKIKLINKENEIEVGIGEFPNNPLKLCASENEEEENVHELITVEKSNVNEVKVGIGEFSNKPLQLLASAALIHNQNIVDKEDVAIALLLVVVFLYNWSNFLSLF